MKCKYPNCGKLRDDSRHDFITINMPICLEYHPFEPAEPEAAPAENIMHKSFDYQADPATSGKVTELVVDQGPQVDTRRVPTAHYFCAECGKTPEPCHHFATTQAVDTSTVPPYPCQGLKNCATKVECLTAVRCLKNLPEAATQATEARKLRKLAEYIWNVRVTALEMPRSKDDFIRKVLQDLSEGIL